MNDLTALNVEKVTILSGLFQHIEKHAQREYEKGMYEAVGFLAKKVGDPVITAAVDLFNHAMDPQSHFFVEPWDQFRAQQTLERAGFEVAGVYHSHPTSEAYPSQSDAKLARAGELVVIYSVAYQELYGWREKGGQLHKVDLDFVDPDSDTPKGD